MTNIGDKMKIDKTPNRIAGMFDRIAPRYDFLNHFLSLGIDRSWRRKTVKAVAHRLRKETAVISDGVKRGDASASGQTKRDAAANFDRANQDAAAASDRASRPGVSFSPRSRETPSPNAAPLLDVATGTADLAMALARRTGRPVTGIDFSAEMLKIGEEKVRKALLDSQITLLEGDALNLPFPADSFSAVTVAFGIRNMADTDRGLSEMVRVCRPGGTVAVLEFSMPTAPILSGFYKTYFLKILPKIGALFSRRSDSAYRYLPASVLKFDSLPEMKARFEKAGLTEIEAVPMTFGIAVLYLGRKTS